MSVCWFSGKLKIPINLMYLFYKGTFSLLFQSMLHMKAHYRKEYFPINSLIVCYFCVIRCKKTTFPICFNAEQPLKVFILQALSMTTVWNEKGKQNLRKRIPSFKKWTNDWNINCIQIELRWMTIFFAPKGMQMMFHVQNTRLSMNCVQWYWLCIFPEKIKIN